ncbi:MAG: hypothetical protein ACI9KE_004775 [Polyangiales bacterium]|jgi:hypothetical protein
MTRLGLILMLALGVACGDDDGRMIDSGPGNTDAGPVTFDTGPATDSGLSLVDSGAGGTDSGPGGTDSGPACTPRPATAIPAALLPRCAMATLQCLIDCPAGDAACQAGCFDADTIPAEEGIDCEICAQQQQLSCATTMGCDSQYSAFDCCVQENACADQACVTANCGAQSNAFQTCVNGVAAGCMPAIQMCFASE